MEPSIWGKYLWTSIHFIALGYPDKPTAEDVANYKAFYTNFWKVLPCYKCSKNYQRHLEELPIDPYMTDNMSLFEWTVLLHNIVNKELGKREWTVEEARQRFRSMVQGGNDEGFVSINHGWDKTIRYSTAGLATVVFIIIAWFVIKKTRLSLKK